MRSNEREEEYNWMKGGETLGHLTALILPASVSPEKEARCDSHVQTSANNELRKQRCHQKLKRVKERSLIIEIISSSRSGQRN